ncbi:MAG TPA: glycosyltransferase [Stellaceae bacterium]|nr:glycosyltransferase [Stellaceae bacterium]
MAELTAARARLEALSANLAKVEAAAATAKDVTHYLTAGLREVTGFAETAMASRQGELARQLVQLWRYTEGDGDVPRPSRAMSAVGKGNGGATRLGFYPLLTMAECVGLQSEIEASGVFDPDWYVRRHPQCGGAAKAVEYFIRVGLAEDHNPHPLFDTAWYRRQVAEKDLNGAFPLLHFLRAGGAQGLSPHPLFDTRWYLEQNPAVAAGSGNPLSHFLALGEAQERAPHPAFDIAWYRQSRPATITILSGRNLLVEYVADSGAHEASPHPLFDPVWYGAHRPPTRADVPLLLDYLGTSVAAGRNPHPLFDTQWYLSAYPDAVTSGLHPFVHFLCSDPAECRQTSPWFDAKWYCAEYADVASSGLHPVVHYLTRGRREGRAPSPSLPLHELHALVRDMEPARLPNIVSFLTRPETGSGDDAARPELPAAYAFNRDEPAPEYPVYWLPDPLREYVIDRFGDEWVPFIREMMGIISRHGAGAAGFARSYDCRRLLAELQELAVDPTPEAPIDMSIVIPVYNGLVYTLTCLRSLFEMKTNYRFEVLIGDDASNDNTDAVLPLIGGRVRYIRHPENLGFLLNCNVTSLHMHGRYVLFLNSDVIILPRWLDELTGLMDSDPQIGLAGSKLLNGDGSLQEAGGIFWSDGSAWNFGRGQNPRLPEFNYVKDADYCSGASIALPAVVWKQLGGFDATYTPAYCEDADIAFRVRALGLRVVYHPFSEIVHHEGKSHGTDTSSGIKAFQVINLAKLFERWWSPLTREHFPNGEHVFLARDRSRLRPHILFIDHYIPQWDQDCGSRLMFLYLKMFVDAGFRVTFWPDNLYEDPTYIRTLQKAGIEVIYSNHYLDKFDSWIEENGAYFNYFFISRPHIAINYIDSVREHSPGTIMYYGHDIHWQRIALQYELTGNAALAGEIELWRDIEARVCQASDVIFYPSDDECAVIREQFPDKQVIELPVAYYGERLTREVAEIAAGDRLRDPFHLMFVGGFGHEPNIDAMLWFTGEIFPCLVERDARFRLTIVGSNPPEAILALKSKRITVTGFISDATLAELYRGIGVAVAPLRYGAGVKGKVIESFSFGAPVVTTSIGMQGIDDPQQTAFVADDADGLVEQVYLAATDRDAAIARIAKAYEFLDRKYSRDHVGAVLGQAVPELRRQLAR